jgi:hypothetical protein
MPVSSVRTLANFSIDMDVGHGFNVLAANCLCFPSCSKWNVLGCHTNLCQASLASSLAVSASHPVLYTCSSK